MIFLNITESLLYQINAVLMNMRNLCQKHISKKNLTKPKLFFLFFNVKNVNTYAH